MIGDQKEVYFGDYCHRCEYKDVDESDPEGKCWECLESPTMQDSHKPLYFKEASENEKSNRTTQKQSNGSKNNR